MFLNMCQWFGVRDSRRHTFKPNAFEHTVLLQGPGKCSDADSPESVACISVTWNERCSIASKWASIQGMRDRGGCNKGRQALLAS